MFYGLQVEPPQDMDVTDYDVDPSMAIWKSMTATGKEGQHLQAEEDMDELHHPSMADLLRARLQEQGSFLGGDIQPVPLKDADNTLYYQEAEVDADDNTHPFSVVVKEPEPDWDTVYQGGEMLDKFLAPLVAEARVGTEGSRVHTEPEEDRDELDHADPLSAVQVDPAPLGYEVAPEGPEVKGKTGVRIHLLPEEDMDDLYHADLRQPVPYNDAVPVQLPADWPTLRKYSQPEDDLDEVFHQ